MSQIMLWLFMGLIVHALVMLVVWLLENNLNKYMPLISSKGVSQTPWSEGQNVRQLEPLGFIKFDILGLSTLRMIEDCIRRVLINNGSRIQHSHRLNLFTIKIYIQMLLILTMRKYMKTFSIKASGLVFFSLLRKVLKPLLPKHNQSLSLILRLLHLSIVQGLYRLVLISSMSLLLMILYRLIIFMNL